MKHYAKKQVLVRAAQWTGKMTPDVAELVDDQHLISVDHNDQLVFHNSQGPGRFARVGDWLLSSSGEDLTVIGDEQFHKIYEEVDENRRSLSTDEEIEDEAKKLVVALDAILVAGLRLSREGNPDIFRERDRLMHRMRHLFDDVRYTSARQERHRIRNKIAEELTP